MKIHVVQDNETLWTISQKYGVSLDAIIAANTQIANPDMIMPGMKIRIPGDTSSKQQQSDAKKKQQMQQPSQQPQMQQPSQQPQMQQPQMQQPAPQQEKKQWLPNIKEDDDKKWEALKKEMPSLPLTFHTKEPIVPPKEQKFPPKEQKLPPKNKTYDLEGLWQKQDTYLKPITGVKQDSKTISPSTPAPPTPSYQQPVANQPVQQTKPSYQPSQVQPQLSMQQPTVHQPVYKPDWCGPGSDQQMMWHHQQQPTHSMHHHPSGFSPNPCDQMTSQFSPYGQQNWNPNMVGGIQQPMLGQMMPMYNQGSMNPMQSPYSMNQPFYQQPTSGAPHMNDCGCGKREES